MNAMEAIRESIEKNQIIHITDTENGNERATLLAKCEDYVRHETEGLTEFWGGEGDSEWRVHLHDAEGAEG